ncbi:hydroxysqualene dehydroxylase HpnE [Terrihabitans sp. B22-R8]|uniref:hydroxysqualene dehydroxylase HpnE n=1 Tax=Terrihabitans sp. B22-R8 TaxID=3425128 RepID=UPI00403C3389
MPGTVHIVGAGLGGLAAAIDLVDAGYGVRFYEAAKAAGGRCRSFVDTVLGIVVDNGSHLLLSGNHAAINYLQRIDGLKEMTQNAAEIPFVDLKNGQRWTLRPNASRLPWWVFDSSRRVPDTSPFDYLAPLGLLRATNQDGKKVGEVMDCTSPLYERLWRPVMLAALNVEPAEADARMAITLFRETFGGGGKACRPLIAHKGMSSAYIDPALRYLTERGGTFSYGRTLRGIDYEGDRAVALDFGDEKVEIAPGDKVLLATPPVVAKAYVPGLVTPEKFKAILNLHFKIAPPPRHPIYMGMVNSRSEWLFAYDDHLSVTISAADDLMTHNREELAREVWAEVAEVTGLPAELPPWQINRERRATFAAIPSEAVKRPGPKTSYDNLFLAGDWTATGLPACMEGAVRSGFSAAKAIIAKEGRVAQQAA